MKEAIMTTENHLKETEILLFETLPIADMQEGVIEVDIEVEVIADIHLDLKSETVNQTFIL